jgi:hypothetical protein
VGVSWQKSVTVSVYCEKRKQMVVLKKLFATLSIISALGFMTMSNYDINDILLFYQLQENTITNEISALIDRTKEHPNVLSSGPNLQINQQELLSQSVTQVNIPQPSQREITPLDRYAEFVSNSYNNVQWFVYNHHGYIFAAACISFYLLMLYAEAQVNAEIPSLDEVTE